MQLQSFFTAFNRQTGIHQNQRLTTQLPEVGFSGLTRSDRVDRLDQDIQTQIANGSVRGLKKLFARQPGLIEKRPVLLTKGLFSAIHRGSLELVETLAQAGASLNLADADGYTPVHRAVLTGNINIVKHLYVLGADLNQPTRDSKISPLQSACASGNVKMVQVLLKLGANPKHTNAAGQQALYTAYAIQNQPIIDMLRQLIEEGKFPDNLP